MQKINELKEKRMAIVKEMRELNDLAATESRNLSAEEQTKWDAMQRDVMSLKDQIDAAEREFSLSGYEDTLPQKEGENTRTVDAAKEFREYLMGERRDVSVGSGGGTLAPEQFVKNLIEAIEKEAPITKLVYRLPVTGAASIGEPTVSAPASDAAWQGETADIGQDATLAFGKRTLAATALAKGIKISKLLQKTSALDIDAIVNEQLARKFAAAIENAIINGSGTNQPLGIFTASANGVAATRDVAAAAVTADALLDLKMKLRPGYRKNAVLIMNTEVLLDVMKLKDKNDQYIWQPSLREGEPDRISGIRVIESEYAPGVKTDGSYATGSYIAAIGDLDYYHWLQSVSLEIQVMREKYGAQFVGYDGLMFADGAPVLGEAFARLKISA